MTRDILRTAHRIHQLALNQVAGEWVQYSDGEVTIRVKATRANSETNEVGEYALETRSDNWLVLTDHMVDEDGNPVRPRIGATITPESGEGVWEVSKGPSGRAFDWSDLRRVRIRIHADQIKDFEVA